MTAMSHSIATGRTSHTLNSRGRAASIASLPPARLPWEWELRVYLPCGAGATGRLDMIRHLPVLGRARTAGRRWFRLLGRCRTEIRWMSGLDKKQIRAFEKLLDALQELGRWGTVHDPVVKGQAQPHGWAHRELTGASDCSLCDLSDAENSALRPVDNRRECFDPEHAEVRDRESTTGEVIAR